MSKLTASWRNYLIVSGIFLLLGLALERLTWSYWRAEMEPRLYREAEAQAKFLGQTLLQAQTLPLEQILASGMEAGQQRMLIENLLDELFLAKAPGIGKEFMMGIKLTVAPDIADNLEIIRGNPDCASCFKVDNIGLISSETYRLIGNATLLADDSFYKALRCDLRDKLRGASVLTALLLGVVWLLVMFLFHQLQHAKEQAASAGHAKTRFLANISHELRTPLNAILGYTQLFQQDKQLMKAYGQAIDTIHRSGEHLLTLINDVLDFAKAESTRLELMKENFDLPEFLQSLMEMTRIRAQFKDLQFVCNTTADLPKRVHADHKRLRQILLNLLSNAVKFTDTGQVEFRIETVDARPGFQTLRFCINDTGSGIQESEHARIFLPFQQISNRKNSAEGAGLGLTISRQLLELMGSHLLLTSHAGAGSRFCFDLELQVTGAVAQKNRERPVSGYRGSVRTLMVVDDNPVNSLILQQLLKHFHFAVEICDSGMACLDFLAGGKKPDLVLLDLLMPDMDGFETVRRIRANPDWRELPVIAVSAAARQEMKERALNNGCDEFLTKPVKAKELLDCLRRHLGLEWDYQDTPPPREAVESKITLPSEDILRVLRNFARQHNILGLRKTLAELEQNPQYRGFSGKLTPLIKQYQFKKIQELLESEL
ncbi:MAG: response regulator [Gammaproteobacteria bacterium]|nr:response regulator [Gammaproteobacteria bacterium]